MDDIFPSIRPSIDTSVNDTNCRNPTGHLRRSIFFFFSEAAIRWDQSAHTSQRLSRWNHTMYRTMSRFIKIRVNVACNQEQTELGDRIYKQDDCSSLRGITINVMGSCCVDLAAFGGHKLQHPPALQLNGSIPYKWRQSALDSNQTANNPLFFRNGTNFYYLYPNVYFAFFYSLRTQ